MRIENFIGHGKYLGYPKPGIPGTLKYTQRLVWASLFYVKDHFKSIDCLNIINASQEEQLKLQHVGNAMNKFVDHGYFNKYLTNPSYHTYHYCFSPLFIQLKQKWVKK